LLPPLLLLQLYVLPLSLDLYLVARTGATAGRAVPAPPAAAAVLELLLERPPLLLLLTRPHEASPNARRGKFCKATGRAEKRHHNNRG